MARGPADQFRRAREVHCHRVHHEHAVAVRARAGVHRPRRRDAQTSEALTPDEGPVPAHTLVDHHPCALLSHRRMAQPFRADGG